jgi:hypothetical protein
MNKVYLSLAVLCGASSIYASDVNSEDLLKRIEVLESKLSANSGSSLGNIISYGTAPKNESVYGKLIIGGDYRFSVDNLRYEMANGSTVDNDSLLTNRLWLNFSYKPNSHIDFNTKLAFNKVFGQAAIYGPNGKAPFDGFDWISSTTNTDDELRVKNAYINYRDDTFFGADLPWDFGVGRRSTSYNKLLSLRDDMKANSPLGHIISAEFDGGHLGFDLEKVSGVSGMHVKLASGRGLSYILPQLSATPDAEWGENINMFDINFVPYADDKIHTEFQIVKITNLIDIANAGYDRTGKFNPQSFNPAFSTVGDMYLGNFMTSYKIKDFDNATVFASYAVSQSKPDAGQTMFGSADDETGTSYWIGMQKDCILTDNAKIGLEYNHGSQYWRSFTYAEDTVAGSKMATRGDAYEFYFTKQIEKGLSFQARYTYMNYDYTGSNGFFGSQTGTAMSIDDVKKYMAKTDMANAVAENAQDIRLYLRYSF